MRKDAWHHANKAGRVETTRKALLRHILIDSQIALGAQIHGAVAAISMVGTNKKAVRCHVRIVSIIFCPPMQPHLIVGTAALRINHAKVGIIVTQRSGVEQRLKIVQRSTQRQRLTHKHALGFNLKLGVAIQVIGGRVHDSKARLVMPRPYLGVHRIFSCRHAHKAVALALHRNHTVVKVARVAVLKNHGASALRHTSRYNKRGACQRLSHS